MCDRRLGLLCSFAAKSELGDDVLAVAERFRMEDDEDKFIRLVDETRPLGVMRGEISSRTPLSLAHSSRAKIFPSIFVACSRLEIIGRSFPTLRNM